MTQLDLFDETDAGDLMDLIDLVSTTLEGKDIVLSFAACGSVTLDCLHDMLATGEEDLVKTALMVSEEFHAEFLTLMAEYGYNVSPNITN